MSKRVNNAKGCPSKNKANNRYLRNMRNERDAITKRMARDKDTDEDALSIRNRLRSVHRVIKALTPKRLLRRHQGR